MKKFFVLLVFFFSALFVQAQYPVVGDWSDVLWGGGTADVHYSVVFDPNSKYVAGTADDVGIEILSVEDGKRVKAYSGDRPYFLKNGKQLAYQRGSWGSYNVIVQDFETDSIIFSKLLEGYNGVSFAISPEEEIIAVGSAKGVHLYFIKTGELLRSKSIEEQFYAANFVDVLSMLYLPDGKQIFLQAVARYGNPRLGFGYVYKYFIWDLETDSLIPSGWLFPVSITPDGTRMVYRGGGQGRIATVIDLRTNEEVGYVATPPPPYDTLINLYRLNDLSISPDGRYVLYTIEEYPGRYFPYYIGIWDIEMNRLVYIGPRTLAGYSCAFSPNGKYFAIGYSILLFDFEKIKRKIEMASDVYEPKAKDALFVYYNPAQVDYIWIEYPDDAEVPTILTIYNMYGEMVIRKECDQDALRHKAYAIPLRELASGIYFVTINSGGKLTTQKFVVTK